MPDYLAIYSGRKRVDLYGPGGVRNQEVPSMIVQFTERFRFPAVDDLGARETAWERKNFISKQNNPIELDESEGLEVILDSLDRVVGVPFR